MRGPLTQLYHNYYKQEEDHLVSELKKLLLAATIETESEILAKFNLEINERFKKLFTNSPNGSESWIKKRVLKRFKHDKLKYKKGVEVDGFIRDIWPSIQREFLSRYEEADELSQRQMQEDRELVNSDDYQEIIHLLAHHDLYIYFFEHRFAFKDEVVEMLKHEKPLVDTNHFNTLTPSEVYEFMKQLQQINPENKKSFLEEKQVYDLTNMICRDQPTTFPLRLNMLSKQKKFIIRFLYDFFKYCQDAGDSKDSRKKYLSILTNYVAPFAEKENMTINETNFSREQPKSPIKIDDKFTRWRNA